MKFEFRPVTFKYLKFLCIVRNQAAEYLHDPTQYSESDVIEWFGKQKCDIPWHIIFMDNVPIGYIRISITHDYKIYIGMDLHEDFRGKGYAHQIYKEFIPWLFIMSGKDDLWLEVLDSNTRAIHIYEKLGFKKQEIKKINRKGIICNSLVYKLNKKNFNVITHG